ncbi:MAG: twin-arginine translocase subunit TatC [Bacteroidales bacterium]|nr:twin-arginine translocase subunit TatC [Bacteroidales bacterium]
MVEEKEHNDNKGFRGEMTFWDHLDELRGHLVRSVIAILILAIVAFLNRHLVFDQLILAPKDSEFLTNRMLCKLADWLAVDALCIDNLSLDIININLSGQFLTHLYISVAAGVILGIPYIIWEMWRFIMPALYPNERKNSRGAVLITSLLFFIGVLFSYFLIVPLTVNFLGTYQVSDAVANQISLKSYINTVLSVIFAVGIVFELPVLIYFFTRIGIVTPDFLKRKRKYMFIIILALSAIITPPDIFSQVLVGIPLFGLYEVSIYISNRTTRKIATQG